MALTRSFLKGMGLTEEQVSAIVEAHAETTDALKGQRDNYKAEAEGLKEAKKELEELKAKGNDGDEWQEKYEAEHAAFEKYKSDEAVAKTKTAKENAFKAILKEVGIPDNRVDSITKITSLEDYAMKDGNFEKADDIKALVKEEWKDFIVNSNTQGTNTQTPPGNDGGSVFKDMSLAEKMQYANDNPADPEVVEWLK